jgi:hypothetical protein
MVTTLFRFQTLTLVLNLVLLGGAACWAQPPAEGPANKIYTHNKSFCLPIALDVRQRSMLQEVQLYVKNGPNEPWICKETAPPTRNEFNYSVSHDGEYWFTIAMVKKNSKLTPAEINRMTPGLVVVVDTQPPDISARMLPPSPRGVLIECTVQDANPDPARLKLEYQGADKMWQTLAPLPEEPTLFRLPGPGVQEMLVRATATDRAGNTATRVIPLATPSTGSAAMPGLESNVTPTSTVTSAPGASSTTTMPNPAVPAASSSPVPSSPAPVPGAMVPPVVGGTQGPVLSPSSMNAPPSALESRYERPSPAVPDRAAMNPGRQLVNETHVSLEYQIEKQGPSGISKVEVWMTRDEGMTWQRLCEDTNRHSPVEFDLPGEGVFGISLVITNGTGFGGTPPTRGDVPDYWVEVDTTRPVAQLSSVRPGTGPDAGTLLISWHASDKNLGDSPIDLYYANHQEGPWQPIARGAKNEGSFRWMLPREAGQEFYIRMEVTDRAGNVARCETPQPLFVDMTRPKARVVGIKASASRSAMSSGN